MRRLGLVALALIACDAHPRAAPTVATVAAVTPALVVVDARADAALRDAAILASIDAPMAFGKERETLTLAYRRQHSDPAASDVVIAPRIIVIHSTGGDSARATRAYFDNPRIEAARTTLARGGAVNVSAHFLVDRNGTIYRLQLATRYARHCIGLNHTAIGIENVGDETAAPLTRAQLAADAALVRELVAQFPIKYLLGHYEVMQFRANPMFVERDATYSNDKPDPDAAFMTALRERVADLPLAGIQGPDASAS